MRRSIIALLLALPLLHASNDAAAETEAQPAAQTTLRPQGDVVGTFRSSSSGTTLQRASVEVRNVGDVEAKDVHVSVTLPGGKSVSLSGPTSLGPNKKATYASDMKESILSTQKLRASVDCENCR